MCSGAILLVSRGRNGIRSHIPQVYRTGPCVASIVVFSITVAILAAVIMLSCLLSYHEVAEPKVSIHMLVWIAGHCVFQVGLFLPFHSALDN